VIQGDLGVKGEANESGGRERGNERRRGAGCDACARGEDHSFEGSIALVTPFLIHLHGQFCFQCRFESAVELSKGLYLQKWHISHRLLAASSVVSSVL
jgi:hypothetical protein